MSTWLINGASPESYGLVLVGGQFASGSVSSVRLDRVSNFDAAEAFAFDSNVTITRDGAPFFRGKVRSIPKRATGDAEGQSYIVEDAWAELERLTYQEQWLIRQPDYTGSAYSPQVVLGMNSAGTRIDVGAQITEALNYAVTAGVSIIAGSVPTGMMLWPTEVTGISVAEVIRTSLKYYPDWIPWLDHSTNPPTFNVTARASATARTLSVTDCEDISVTKTHDRVPTGVRITYMTSYTTGDEVYRSMTIDKHPAGGEVAASPPGVLCTTVELAGQNVQIQKQQVQTRAIPTDSSTAKAYLKKKFPWIKDIPDANLTVGTWTRTFIPEDDDAVDPIDTKLARMQADDIDDIPRELVKGSVAEWMRRKIGRLRITCEVGPSETATADEKKLIAKIPGEFVINGTNAITKIYKGISSYEAGDAAPTGVAQAYYETLVNGCYFEGQVTLTEDEVGDTRWHGSKLNLTDGDSEWATMGAPIHTVDWDLSTCQTTINFGPNPDFAIQDFMEFLKLLNKRPYSSFTTEERTGDSLGSGTGISARGDTIGQFDIPETIYSSGAGGVEFVHPFKLSVSRVEDDLKWVVSSVGSTVTDGINGAMIDLTASGSGWASGGIPFDTPTVITASKLIVLQADVDDDLVITDWTLAAVDDAPEADYTSTPPIYQNKIRVLIGAITVDTSPDPDTATAKQALFTALRIIHAAHNGVVIKTLRAAPSHLIIP